MIKKCPECVSKDIKFNELKRTAIHDFIYILCKNDYNLIAFYRIECNKCKSKFVIIRERSKNDQLLSD